MFLETSVRDSESGFNINKMLDKQLQEYFKNNMNYKILNVTGKDFIRSSCC